MNVLIIGASASKDFHPEMGTGRELVEGILNRVVEDILPDKERYFSKILEELKKDVKNIRDGFALVIAFILTPMLTFQEKRNTIFTLWKD